MVSLFYCTASGAEFISSYFTLDSAAGHSDGAAGYVNGAAD